MHLSQPIGIKHKGQTNISFCLVCYEICIIKKTRRQYRRWSENVLFKYQPRSSYSEECLLPEEDCLHPPAASTDAVCLYLLNSRYSRMSSLIRRFSWDSGGRGSRWSSSALNTSARIRAFNWLSTPWDSRVSLTAAMTHTHTRARDQRSTRKYPNDRASIARLARSGTLLRHSWRSPPTHSLLF